MKRYDDNTMDLSKSFIKKPGGIFTSAAVKSFEENIVNRDNFLEESRKNIK